MDLHLLEEETEVDIDFSDEVTMLSSVIVLAQQVGEQWNDIGLSDLRCSLDDQAVAITENREEVKLMPMIHLVVIVSVNVMCVCVCVVLEEEEESCWKG